jgi:hypothetical protein
MIHSSAGPLTPGVWSTCRCCWPHTVQTDGWTRSSSSCRPGLRMIRVRAGWLSTSRTCASAPWRQQGAALVLHGLPTPTRLTPPRDGRRPGDAEVSKESRVIRRVRRIATAAQASKTGEQGERSFDCCQVRSGDPYCRRARDPALSTGGLPRRLRAWPRGSPRPDGDARHSAHAPCDTARPPRHHRSLRRRSQPAWERWRRSSTWDRGSVRPGKGTQMPDPIPVPSATPARITARFRLGSTDGPVEHSRPAA